MAGRYGISDYSRLTKRAFATGFVSFVVGLLGEMVLHATQSSVPTWEETLLLDLELVGVAVMLFSPFVFGILLPLTD